jgi:hypothetical protein
LASETVARKIKVIPSTDNPSTSNKENYFTSNPSPIHHTQQIKPRENQHRNQLYSQKGAECQQIGQFG